ncbi:urease accessory protein UreD [Phreatobacter sp.]|uniref:urease accessory protein UreD n=1 Tax=Phreatobacter sp. TaxID=1966341 RepID=UPI003F719C67
MQGVEAVEGRAWRKPAPALERAQGAARLVFARRGDATVLRQAYQEAAVRVLRPRVEPGEDIEAVLINTAGGITGGDRFSLDIALEPGTRATVTTQAAEKVYRSSGGIGTLTTAIRLDSGAHLAWLPQETILFDGSALERRLDVAMAPDATLIAAESIVFGRIARGERVEAASLFDRWRIRRGGRLIFAEGLRLEGPVAHALLARAAGAGAVASALLLVVAPDAEPRLEGLRERIDTLAAEGVEIGASAFEGMLAVRLVGRDAFALRLALAALLEHLRGPLPRVWSC